MSANTKRSFLFWVGRSVLGIVSVLAVVAAAGTAYQAIASARDSRAYPPPGRLVDVGGHRLHIFCTGETQPSLATIILEAGTASPVPAWQLVQSSTAASTRVCSYDRAGNGWSEAGPLPRDARQIVSELHALLGREGIGPPYVLVGHSFGGMYVRAYTDAYPDEVAGIVLIDSSHPDQLARSSTRSAAIEGFKGLLRIAPVLMAVGIVRFFNLAADDYGDLPPRQRSELAAISNAPQQAAAELAELEAFAAVTDALHATAGLGDRPLYVLSAGKDTDPDWPGFQAELATLSTNSVHHTVEGVNHSGLILTSEGVAATTAAISTVLETARTGERLSQ